MGASTTHKRISIALLSIILPVSLLVTFRLTGIIPEPQTPEIVMLEPVNWSMERPSRIVTIKDDKIENVYSRDDMLLNMSLDVFEYLENALMSPYDGRDGLSFGIVLAVRQGRVFSIVVRCSPIDASSVILIDSNYWSLELSNASTRSMKEIGTNDNDAYIYVEVSSSPCSLKTMIHWVFQDENTEEHKLKTTLQVVYFNGTMYKEVEASMFLQVWPRP